MSYSRKKTKTIDEFNDLCFIAGVGILFVMVTPLIALFYLFTKMVEFYMERKKHGKKCKW